MKGIKIEFNFGTGYDARILTRAASILSGKADTDLTDELELDRCNFNLVFPAVYAVCQAIIREGRMPVPLAVDMRFETSKETEEKMHGLAVELIGKTGGDRHYLPA